MDAGLVDWSGASAEEVAAGFAAGMEACLDECFRRWSPLVYTFAYRLLTSHGEAEDVTQQVFVGAWRSRGSYRPEADSLAGSAARTRPASGGRPGSAAGPATSGSCRRSPRRRIPATAGSLPTR